MKLLNTFLFILFLCNPIFSQNRVVNFGSSNLNTICSDGYIDELGNSIALFHNDLSGFMIGSFDKHFNTNWIKSFGVGSGASGKLIRLSNGDFFGSILQDSNGKAHIFKISSQGIIYWHKIFNNVSNFSDCIELENNNIAVIGRYGVDAFVSVFNPNGIHQFSKMMSDGHGNNYQSYYDLINTNDGNLMLIGGCSHPSHLQRIALTKFDKDFNLIWIKSFEYNAVTNDVRNSTQDLSNNYYLVGGSADTASISSNDLDLSILKFDSLGNFSIGKSYGSEFRDIAEDIETTDLAETGNNNLTIIGHSKPVEICGDNLLVVSLNSSLDTNFTKIYGNSNGTGVSYTELHLRNDSLYTFGSYALWSNIGLSDGHLIKTDKEFALECEFYSSGLENSMILQLNEIVNPFVLVDTALSLTNSNVFSNSNIIIKDACSGAILGAEENEVLEFTLYPNPTSKTINIISEFKIDQIKMFDVTGLKILSKKQSSNFLQIDISEFKQGTYIIEIHSATKVLRKKLIIE